MLHSAETLRRRSSGFEVLIVAVRSVCVWFALSTSRCEPDATALLAGWAPPAARTAGTATAAVAAIAVAITVRRDSDSMRDLPFEVRRSEPPLGPLMSQRGRVRLFVLFG